MKQSRAYLAFLHKVELVESWVAAGQIPPGEVLRRGPTALAKWTDDARGLVAWRSPNVAAPAPSGHYPELRARYDRAIEALAPRTVAKPPSTASLKRQVRGLAEQVGILTSERLQLATELERERQLKEIAQAQLADARAELARIVPFR